MAFKYVPQKHLRKLVINKPLKVDRRKQEALAHLESGWLPVNEQVLEQIKENVTSGYYRKHHDQLLEDLKQDPALLFYCMKKLQSIPRRPNPDGSTVSDLQQLEEQELLDLLQVSPNQISKHRRQDATQLQSARASLTKVSAEAAEKLAPIVHISEDLAYTSTLLRQLGHDLIAWNYPRLYAKVISEHPSPEKIELKLKSLIGITPLQVGQKFARDWHLPREVLHSLASVHEQRNERSTGETTVQHSQVQMSLYELANLSELFAQSHQPTYFPNAPDAWAAKEDVLKVVFGQELIEELHDIAEHAFLEPEIDHDIPEEEPELEFDEIEVPQHLTDEELRNLNRYLNDCPAPLKEKFRTVYETTNEAEISLDAIRLLVGDVIPASGFVRGCLFLEDKESLALKPALRVGDWPLEAYKKFIFDGRNGIATAQQGHVPLRNEGFGIDGLPADQICASFDSKAHPGVLYLEINEGSSEFPTPPPLRAFQAIRQALKHCIEGRESS